jgi:hypothetical protein|eukprot:COSAG03_NODE_20_length_21605_cov_27.875523_4_plen_550_part_00
MIQALEEAAAETFARTASDSAKVRDEQRHVETLLKARTKLLKTKNVAMGKLEHNRTVDYDPVVLEDMGREQMIALCKQYQLQSRGTTEELRDRLGELLLSERKRSNAYKKKVSAAVGAEAEQRAVEAIQQYELKSLMAEEEFAGLYDLRDDLDPREQEALTKMAMDQRLENAETSSLQTRRALAELQAWHDSFEPIEAPSSHLTQIEQALAGMHPHDWMGMKERGYEGKKAVETKVQDVLDDVRLNAQRLKALEQLIEQAKQDNAANARKLHGLKAQHHRLQGEYERKIEEKSTKQAAVGQTKRDAINLKEQLRSEQAEWVDEQHKLEKEEELLQADVDALAERYGKELDALHRKHEEAEKKEGEVNRRKNEKMMKMQMGVDQQFEEHKTAKLQEMLKKAVGKEETDTAALREQVDAQEAIIAELAQKIKDKVSSKIALQGEVLRLAQAERDAREAEEDAERAAKRDRELWKELEEERTDFEWYMKHVAPTAGQSPEEKGCQAGSDDKSNFDKPMIDGGTKLEAARLHFPGDHSAHKSSGSACPGQPGS